MLQDHGSRIRLGMTGVSKDCINDTHKQILAEERFIDVSRGYWAESQGETFHEKIAEHHIRNLGCAITMTLSAC